MTSIYKLIGLFSVFLNINYAAYDIIAIIASKGAVPYSAIRASKPAVRASSSSEILDSCETKKQPLKPCYEGVAAPLLPRDGLYQPSTSTSLPLCAMHSQESVAEEMGELPQQERNSDQDTQAVGSFIPGGEVGVGEPAERGVDGQTDPVSFQPPLLGFSLPEAARELDSTNLTGNVLQYDDQSTLLLNDGLVTQEAGEALSTMVEDPVGGSLGSSFSVISSVVVVSKLPSFRTADDCSTSDRGGFLSKHASIANFDDIASSDDEKPITDVSFAGLVPDEDSNSLDCLTGEFRETLEPASDSDDEVLHMVLAPQAGVGNLRILYKEKMTVTFTRNNRKVIVERSKPAATAHVILRSAIALKSIINPAPLTPINQVFRPVQKAESRSSSDRLREARGSCVVPIRFELNPLIKFEVVKVDFTSKPSGRLSVET